RLAPNGRLFLEIGCEQAAAVAEILQKQGYREVQVFQDLAGKDRIVQCIV
ncbi:MAG TPA: peptide chain release factor N(5)-glutamine methyltransferase, partial [Lachnospiraceae bacterium]|nr:peptide chain release factor N(5)-glutamine methyltransferase [Lachnospiraceae bacterium]